MKRINDTTNNYNKKDLNYNLKKDYIESLKDDKFKALVNRLKLTDEIGCKYTSKLEQTVNDLKNCDGCKGLVMCKNKINGCIFYPEYINNRLDFNYVACKYKNNKIKEDSINKSKYYGVSEEIKKAKIKDIYTDDKSRKELIKWIVNFYKEYPKNKKGLYLHGSFGCGKTYIISALLNEFAKDNYNNIIIYYPELLNKLKSSFDDNYSDIFESVKTCDMLLLDDIGSESVTNWSRDDILGTILQYRMENNKTTFFTSNLTIDELETNLSISKNNVDKVKARRIIERIKQLTIDSELISKNRRN